MEKSLRKQIDEEMYEISKMQKYLDDVIINRFTELKGKDNVVWKINALVVEMGECLQEWRGFKMWSKNQTPNYDEMKEEYVDWFHFIVSIGLEFGYDFKNALIRPEHYYSYYKSRQDGSNELEVLNNAILEWNMLLFTSVKKTGYDDYVMESELYRNVLSFFIAIGMMLGFTWEDIYTAYIEKNKENHTRQQTNY